MIFLLQSRDRKENLGVHWPIKGPVHRSPIGLLYTPFVTILYEYYDNDLTMLGGSITT
jgi:hypothetical protein